MVSVSSSLEAMLSNTTLSALKGHSYLVQSCLEIGWLGRTEGVCLSVCLWVCAVMAYCHTGRGKRQPLPLAQHSCWLSLLILSVSLITGLIVENWFG